LILNTAKLLAAGLAVSSFLSVSPASAAIGKHIRDWSVSCTTGLTCSMVFANWASKDLRSLEFRRVDAPNADVQLILSPPPGFDTPGDPDGAYAFSIDGKQVLSVPVAGLGKEGINVQLVYSDQPAIRALLDAMKAGTTMEVVYQGALGRFSLPVKLSGVKGSLVYIDEAQDRLQRTDALDAKGDKSPPNQTVAADIRTVDDLPDAIRRDFADESGACSELDSDIGSYQGFDITVDDNRWIVAPCGIGGAYNQPYALYVGYDVITERISFPSIRDGKPSVSSTAYNVDFDLKAKTFTAFFRGRGIGDCGLWSKWKLAEGGSPTLVLLEERRKDDCDGNDLGGPQNFPLVWPTKP
jgi:invasion protein IalB